MLPRCAGEHVVAAQTLRILLTGANMLRVLKLTLPCLLIWSGAVALAQENARNEVLLTQDRVPIQITYYPFIAARDATAAAANASSSAPKYTNVSAETITSNRSGDLRRYSVSSALTSSS